MQTIPLYGKTAAGRVTCVDDDDYEKVSKYRWHIWEDTRQAGRPNGPYAQAHMYRDGRRIYIRMHTFITGWARVDHVDHDGLNNQRGNLRPATVSQNGANRRKQAARCTSVFKGVYWHRGKQRWYAHIRIDGKRHFLGLFVDEGDAARAYDAAALAAWEEYAHLNFPPTPG